jgi:hypothetical protein
MTALSKRIFDSDIEQKLIRWYRRIFSVHELEESTVLQFVFGATLLSHLITFSQWSSSTMTTVDAYQNGMHLCWPYFQGCGRLLWLHTLPEGYSQPTLYMIFFGLFLFIAYCMYRKDWLMAHIVLVPAFLWHTYVIFVLTQAMTGNYEYYLFVFTGILLFLPHKEYFLKLSVVSFYVMSTMAKIHEAWILGTYFSALKTGLPLFPDWSIPLLTNTVIFMEMVGSWFLMSRRWQLQRSVLAFFVFFHLYSGIIVGFRYPTIVLPTMFILFGPLYRHTAPPSTRRSIAGWLCIALLFTIQCVPKLIPGDEKLTLEGNMYGLYMFESNHQCVSQATVHRADGTTENLRDESTSARDRCDPYSYWFRIHTLCSRDESIDHVAWTFDHSINGGPFLRIVDVQDACILKYHPFRHNEWIMTEKDAPEMRGHPVENIYI